MDCFILKNNNTFLCSHLPQVEFSTVFFEDLKKKLNNYNLIVIENYNLETFEGKDFKNFLNSIFGDIICVVRDLKTYNFLLAKFEYKLKIVERKQKTIFSNQNLNLFISENFGSTTLACGYALKLFIEKKDVKWISFKKKINFEEKFFRGLKKLEKNKIYGSFDFIVNKKNCEVNEKKEILENFKILKTTTKKNNYTIADEFLCEKLLNIIDKEEIIIMVKNLKSELILTGVENLKLFDEIFGKKIEIKKE